MSYIQKENIFRQISKVNVSTKSLIIEYYVDDSLSFYTEEIPLKDIIALHRYENNPENNRKNTVIQYFTKFRDIYDVYFSMNEEQYLKIKKVFE